MKKILIISKAFYPNISPRSFRATELAKEFSRQGHDVTVITEFTEDQESLVKENGIKIIDLGKPFLKPIELKGGAIEYNLRRFLRRGLLMLFEFPDIELIWQVKKKIKRIDKEFDLLISIAFPYPIHWGISFSDIKKNKVTKTWIADCGDPYMGDKTDTFRKLFYFSFLERRFCKLADWITIPIESAKVAYHSNFQSKIKVIPQGFNFKQTLSYLDEYIPNQVVSFVYAGTIIPGLRDIRPILDYLSNSNLDFRFYVFTQSQELIRPYLDKLSKKIIVSGFIPRPDLIKHLSKMDFLLNIDNGGVVENLPSKLIDYKLSGRPILSLNSQNLDTNKLDQFLNNNYENCLEIKNVARYNIKNVVQEFLSLAERK